MISTCQDGEKNLAIKQNKSRREFIKWFQEKLPEIHNLEDDPETIAWEAWQSAWKAAFESGNKVGRNQVRYAQVRNRRTG